MTIGPGWRIARSRMWPETLRQRNSGENTTCGAKPWKWDPETEVLLVIVYYLVLNSLCDITTKILLNPLEITKPGKSAKSVAHKLYDPNDEDRVVASLVSDVPTTPGKRSMPIIRKVSNIQALARNFEPCLTLRILRLSFELDISHLVTISHCKLFA